VRLTFGQWRSAEIKFQKTSDTQTEVTFLQYPTTKVEANIFTEQTA
jgi:hypothetical protein